VPKVVVIIPARYDSTRFPGKVLHELLGRPMLLWVYERASLISLADEVIVATDDLRVFDAVKDFGGKVLMTSKDHQSGSDRIAEASLSLDCDIVVNVQGDEPTLDPNSVDLCLKELLQDPALEVATLRSRIREARELFDPNTVKVVCSLDDYALYFSRSPIPFYRDLQEDWEAGTVTDEQLMACPVPFYKHIGVYVFRKDFLIRYSQMVPTPLQQAEKLEQLRLLESGYMLKTFETEAVMKNVDSPEDVQDVEELLRELHFKRPRGE